MAAASRSPSPGSGLSRKVGPLPVWVLLAAAVAVVGYLYVRHRAGSSSANFDTTATPSQTPGFDSAAQAPASGGGSSAGNLSEPLIVATGGTTAPDTTTTQVQQTDTTSPAAPTMQAAQLATPPPVYIVNNTPIPVSAGTTAGGAPTGHGPQLVG
jgi:hypothetical protein